MGEIQRYTTDIRSMTGGRGLFSMSLSHYEVIPAHVTEAIIAARDKELSKQESE
jgi:elongation factor G